MGKYIDAIRYNDEDYRFIGQNLNIYSTEEQLIGVWTNGKPLYRKTFYSNHTFNTTTASEQYHINHNISDIEDGWINNTASYLTIEGTNYGLNGCYISQSTTMVAARATVSDTQIGIDFYARQLSFYVDICVTIEYTKTTDKVSTLPINMLSTSNNYSTEEVVIGTYKNKPLYRKIVEFSFEKTTTDVVSGNVELDTTIEKIVNFNGNFTSSVTHDGIIFGYPANSLYSSTEFARVYFVERTTTGVKGLYYDFANARTGITITAEITIEYTKTTD